MRERYSMTTIQASSRPCRLARICSMQWPLPCSCSMRTGTGSRAQSAVSGRRGRPTPHAGLLSLTPQQPSQKFEGDWCDGEGVRHRWRWVYRAVFNESGQVDYVIATEIDIAGWGARVGSWCREDEIAAQHQAVSCELRFTTVFEQLPIPTVIFNPESWVLVGNQASADLYGIAPEHAKAYNMIADPNWAQLGVDLLVKKTFTREAVAFPLIEYDSRKVAPDVAGSRWVRLFYFPIKQGGRLHEVVLIVLDLTEQKLAEDALRKTHAELEDRVRHRTAELQSEIVERQRAEQALLEEKERVVVTLRSIGDAVISTDPVGRVRSMSPAAKVMTGWPEADVIGRPLAEVFGIFDEDTREPAVDPVRRCIEHGRITGLAGRSVLLARSGEELGIDDSASPIFGRQGGILGTVIVFRDVTQQRRYTRELSYHAQHDPLTGLVNRREFERRLTQTVVSARKYGTQHALCFLDLDQFKAVNDGAGHAAGDELLRQITALLLEGVRERDTVARLGGDEFGLLLANCPPDKAIALTEAIIAQIRDHRFVWEGQAFHIGASIGIVPIGAPAPAAPDLMRQADLACYSAKHGGRNRTYLWEEGRAQVGAVLSLEDLRAALHGNLVQIEYQRMALSHSSPAFARALRVVLAPVECGRRTHTAQRLHSGGGALSNHGQDRSLGHQRGLGGLDTDDRRARRPPPVRQSLRHYPGRRGLAGFPGGGTRAGYGLIAATLLRDHGRRCGAAVRTRG